MQYVVHEVNTLKKLNNIDLNYGVEVDIRYRDGRLVVGHDINELNLNFTDWLDSYGHKLLVANIKESGIEDLVIKEITNRKIDNFFLLDVEFPYIVKNMKNSGSWLSNRFSEYEDISNSKHFIKEIKWLWIDTFNILPINELNIDTLKKFKTCLVSPSRWGRLSDVGHYIDKMKELNYLPNAVMVEENEADLWKLNISE